MSCRRAVHVAAAVLTLPACTRAPDSEPQRGSSQAVPSSQHVVEPAASAGTATQSDPGVVFRDVTGPSGLKFVHETGGYGEKLLPETMGSGAAFLDVNGDGKLDIFLVNSTWWPGHEPPGKNQPTCALYLGRGDGTFVDAGEQAGANVAVYGMGCFPADFDGDQDPDVLITTVGGLLLLVNDRGSLRDGTAAAELPVSTFGRTAGANLDPNSWYTAAAWADFDADGDLDLLVGRYVQWTPALEIFTTLDGSRKAFTTPDRYRGLPPRLYLNRGNGTFEERTEAAGLGALEGKALGAALWDFDGDGLLECVVSNDTRPTFFLANLGGGRFEERGLAAGIAYDESGRARAGMGIDVEAIHGDGVPYVAIGNFADEPISLYRWLGKTSSFASEAARAGLAEATFAPLTFGLEFLDVDLDGRLDLILANGHIEPDVQRMFRTQTYAQSLQLFLGRDGGAFSDASAVVGSEFTVPRVGRGLAAGDVDGDGDLDLLVTANGGPAALLRNDRAAASANHFIRVRLRGKGNNTGALGARVDVRAGGRSQTRLARTGSSYLSGSEETLTFGLGAATSVERLEVRWPSGVQHAYPVERVDATIEIREE
jgi:hypothetical protein